MTKNRLGLSSPVLRIDGVRRSSLEAARGRVVFISFMIVVAYTIVAIRVLDVSLIQGEFAGYSVTDEMLVEDAQDSKAYYAAPRQKPALSEMTELHIPRADIVDRNGVLLATSLETASLYVDPYLVQNPEETAAALAQIFSDLGYGKILQKLQRSGRFVWLKRNITPDQQFKVLKIGSPGLAFQTEYRRFYPQNEMFAHMVGYTNVDGLGLSGLERSFSNMLNESAAPENAMLKTTFDVRLQHVLTRELSKTIEDFRGIGGAGMIMDVNTGEVLAATSMPDFNPHDPSSAQENGAGFNRLSLGVYELGSTFKIFSTAAVIEFAGARLSDRFDARETIRLGRFKISDYHAEDRILTLPEVFMVSSNIGSAIMGQMVGTDMLKNFYRDLGLLDRANLEINEVGAPLVPSPWRDVNTLTATYGHGVAVSPMQMVSAAASIVNGGLRVQPTFIYQEDKERASRRDPDVRVVSAETAHRMRQLLRLVVTDGTGRNADVAGFRVGGKTGTAEKIVDGRYDQKKLISSFIGFFPMNAPRYAVFVMVDEPKGTRESFGYATGGWVAAPAVKRIISSMASVLAIEPQRDVVGIADDDLVNTLRDYIAAEDSKGKLHKAFYGGGTLHKFEDYKKEDQ